MRRIQEKKDRNTVRAQPMHLLVSIPMRSIQENKDRNTPGQYACLHCCKPDEEHPGEQGSKPRRTRRGRAAPGPDEEHPGEQGSKPRRTARPQERRERQKGSNREKKDKKPTEAETDRPDSRPREEE